MSDHLTTIRSAAELDALPVGSVIVDQWGDVAVQVSARRWRFTDTALMTSLDAARYEPLRILYRPDASPDIERDARVLREAANAIGDTMASSDYLADEISDDGIAWVQRWLRERADAIAAEIGGGSSTPSPAIWDVSKGETERLPQHDYDRPRIGFRQPDNKEAR